jgi:PPK2 family polyphosphate:nucleotide phosphotransferase
MPAKHARSFAEQLIVKPGAPVELKGRDAGDTLGWDKDAAGTAVEATLERLNSLQERLWAEKQHAVLVVLQGIDTSGKDGAIRHVMRGLNPQGVKVTGFGVPSAVEAAHDHLWRIHAAAPGRGEVGVFNRSHYESVLVVRVHELVPKSRWEHHFAEINAFEDLLTRSGTSIVKFFLHIDSDEQRERLQARYDDPTKQWKFSLGDLEERRRWDDYMAAYEDALTRCSTEAAPWYVIPANRKWFRNLAIGDILADRIEALKPAYPVVELPPDLVIT